MRLSAIETGATITILPYPDVQPQAWRALPASAESIHLIWLEADQRLRSAIIQVDGTTLRGPVTLAQTARPGFQAIGRDCEAVIIWQPQAGDPYVATILDHEGRPRNIGIPAISQGPSALAHSNSHTLSIAWAKQQTPSEYEIRISTVQTVPQQQAAYRPVAVVQLAPTESIEQISIAAEESFVHILWTITDAQYPGQVRATYLATVPAGEDDPVRVQTLDFGYMTGDNAQLLAAEGVRWVSLSASLEHHVWLSASLRTADGWRPALAPVRDAQVDTLTSIAERPANAAPPIVTWGTNNTMWIAWKGLVRNLPHLFIAQHMPLVSEIEYR